MKVSTALALPARELKDLGILTTRLAGRLAPHDILSGRWFTKLLAAYLEQRGAQPMAVPTIDEAERAQRSEQAIHAACVEATLWGAAAAGVTTGSQVLTADSGGWAGLVVLPAAAAGIGAEMFMRAWIHLRLACDLGDLYGVRFDPRAPAELARLQALAFGTHEHEDAGEPGALLVRRLARLDAGDSGGTLGSALVSDSLLRNVLPFVGIAVSGVQSWTATRRVGEVVQEYVRFRRALDAALADAARVSPNTFDLIIEGIWFVFIADGRLTAAETAVLAHLLHEKPVQIRHELGARLITEAAGFFTRLSTIESAEARAAVFRVLAVAAAADGTPSAAEQEVLAQAARALATDYVVEWSTGPEDTLGASPSDALH
ncbi:MAG TPA: hypothetical protein VGQ83_11785 [Polyangia bacterium]|jgi:hypothetical protein